MKDDIFIMSRAWNKEKICKWPCSPGVLVVQWMECLPGVWEVTGLISFRDSDFFFLPRL